ncbi:apoptosis-stimulating of p53 protein 2-like isoform X3 [Lineus longissimus]|uniref:apoptosis-stimulating of p53 protein 2-like isoform X3 n=1 Tax=Lineus longissimus TaxID=88925 RepID=UPI00315CD012
MASVMKSPHTRRKPPPYRRDKKKNGMNDYHFGQDIPMMPGGVDLTLTELQEMATRQQQQIENQQQMLVAKEQRLKYLKQQEMRHQQIASENERLRKLREKVESQELKLKKLRALRGQVDQQRMSNGNLNSELESIKVLFNEKEKELSIAVAKVEELTKQLDEVKRGNNHAGDGKHKSSGDAELEKLKKELMIRNKLNEQQSTKLNAHREVLSKRHEEITMMDTRIEELQERLHKKRQQQQQQQQHKGFPPSGRPQSANIAAVEPYVRTEQKDSSKDDLYEEDLKSGLGPSKQQPRYQTLPYNTKFPVHLEGQKQPQQDINSNIYNYEKKLEANNNMLKQENNKPEQKSVENKSGVYLAKEPVKSQPSQFLTSKVYNVTQDHLNSGIEKRVPTSTFKGGSSGITHFTPRPFSSTYSSVSFNPTQGPADKRNVQVSQPQSSFTAQGQAGALSKPLYSEAGKGAPTNAPITPPRLSTKYTMSQDSSTSPGGSSSSTAPHSSPDVSPGYYQTAISRSVQPPQPSWADSPSSSQSSPSQNPQSPPVTNTRNVPTTGGYGPTVAVSRNTGSNSGLVVRVTNNEGFAPSPNSSGDSNSGSLVYNPTSSGAENTSNGKMVPNIQNKNDSERAEYPSGRLDQNTSYEGPNISVSSANSSSGSMPSPSSSDSSAATKPRFAPRGVIANTYMRKLGSTALSQYNKLSQMYQGFPNQPQQGEANQGAKQDSNQTVQPMGKTENVYPNDVSPQESSQKTGEQSPPDSDNGSFQVPGFHQYGTINADKFSSKGITPRTLRRRHSSGEGDDLFTKLQFQSAKPSVSSVGENEEDASKGDAGYFYEGRQNEMQRTHSNSTGSTGSEEEKRKPKSAPLILRKKGSKSKAMLQKRRVSFDPLALLLDASLEGELELVMRTAKEVSNPSTANDEGITALHNAICAGHFEIVKFLVEFGCDVNSQDSDGWTPLHCAASCNNLAMVQFLVEHGACIFATTISDHETAAEKCEEDEDGYDGCSEYLYSIQEKLGILNAGEVYSLYNYKAQNPDEMTFKTNDKLVVLRKVDQDEREWWWARKGAREGYIPRNLLGLFPRVKPPKENDNES